MIGECKMDHSFNGTEDEIGRRPGEEGPLPPSSDKESRHKDMERLKHLMMERGIL